MILNMVIKWTAVTCLILYKMSYVAHDSYYQNTFYPIQQCNNNPV